MYDRRWIAGTVQVLACALLVAAVSNPTAGSELPTGSAAHDLEASGHREAPDMAPWRGEDGRLRTAPLPAAALKVGDFQSIQVNTDADGANIVGDAANEPSIAVDPTNPSRLVVGWRQFDAIASNFRQAGRAISADAGLSWTNLGVFTPGTFRSDPVLEAGRNGTFYYYSLDGTFNCQMFISNDGGQTWTDPIPALGGDKAWVVVDDTQAVGLDRIYIAWNTFAGCCDGATFTRSFDGGLSYDTAAFIPEMPLFGSICVDPAGDVYVVGRTPSSPGQLRVAKSTDAKNVLVPTPTFTSTPIDLGGSVRLSAGPNPGGLLGQLWIQSDRSGGPNDGNLYVFGSVNPPGPDPLDVMFSRSIDGGETWSAPVRINQPKSADDNSWQWFGTMDVSPDGRIDVIWNDTRNDLDPSDPTLSEIVYRSSFDGGETWTDEQIITPQFNHFLGYPMQNKLGDYYQLRSDRTGASLIYAATFNGEQDVYFVRIGDFDCNANGIPDAQDLAMGATDCNDNGRPDECEPDCNGNEIADECDIASGFAPDCNSNGVPDSCDIASGFDFDCNGNGIPDGCDVAVEDCNGNLIPDDCEADCNENGIPDQCDIAADPGLDCDGNFQPDSCDIASGLADDCDANGTPDVCDLAVGTALDCNANGIPDSCDIASGFVDDCNLNGIPDSCDLIGTFRAASLPLSPLAAGTVLSYDLPGVQPALGDVEIRLEAIGDLNTSLEFLSLTLNGTAVGDGFVTGAADCPQSVNVDALSVPPGTYNAIVANGPVRLEITPSPAVGAICAESFVRVTVTHQTDSAKSTDVNGNGTLDECEDLGDLDCSGSVSVADINAFVLALTDPGAYTKQFPECDPLRADANGDGQLSVADINGFVVLVTPS